MSVDEGNAFMNNQNANGVFKVINGTSGGATTLAMGERLVGVKAPASGTHTVTLPPACSVPGETFHVEIIETAGSGNVTVTSGSADVNSVSQTSLAARGDFARFKSDGSQYHKVAYAT